MANDTDDWLLELAAEIRSGTDDDPAARERILRALETGRDHAAAGPGWLNRHHPAAGRGWLNRFGQWVIRPRPVAISPLGWAGLVLLVVGLSAGWLRHPASEPGSLVGAGAPAASQRKWAAQFVVVAPGASRVTVVGDFNNWDPDGTPLQRSGRDGVWTQTLLLPAGVYSYNYVVDGRLQHAEDEPDLVDEFGGGHSIIIVGEGSS